MFAALPCEIELMTARRPWILMLPSSEMTSLTTRGEAHFCMMLSVENGLGEVLTAQLVIVAVLEDHLGSTRLRSACSQDLHQTRRGYVTASNPAPLEGWVILAKRVFS